MKFDIYKNFPIKITITVMMLIISSYYINEIIMIEMRLFKPVFLTLGIIIVYFVVSVITDVSLWLGDRNKNEKEGEESVERGTKETKQ